MKRNIFFIVLAITLIAIIVLSIMFSSDKTEDLEILTEAKLGTFKVEITSAGELDAKNSVNIEGPFGLRRARIWEVKIEDMVDEGTVVKKGDYVARLDAAELSDRIQNEEIIRFWKDEFPKYTKNDLVPILNKVGAFLAHPSIKRFLITNPYDISLRKAMDQSRILLIDISKGKIGVDASYLIGSILITSFANAAFSRIDTPEEKRKPFHIFLDEFQNYTSPSISGILSELRKFKISLTLANQYLHQLEPDIKNAVLGNVGTLINKIDPINKGETVWTVTPQDLVIIGELLLTGKFNAERTIALVGSQIEQPRYLTTRIGSEVATLVNEEKPAGIYEINFNVFFSFNFVLNSSSAASSFCFSKRV